MRFELFGFAHLVTLAVIASLGGLYARWGHARSALARGSLVVVLLGGLALFVGDRAYRGVLGPAELLPLHLCDMSILLALWALAVPTARTHVGQLLFFWTTTGTLLACVTPALRSGFPSVRFISYFVLHAGVIWSALYLYRQESWRLDVRAVLRAWGWTQLYGLLVLAVDLSSGRNYMFLLRKPHVPTLLDIMGPWPVYILVVDVLALFLFAMVAALTRMPSLVSRHAIVGVWPLRRRRAAPLL